RHGRDARATGILAAPKSSQPWRLCGLQEQGDSLMSTTVDTAIDGVQLTKPKVFGDGRGAFFEAFRASWFAGERRWVQWNVSKSAGNVVRGLHFHKIQTDYWLVTDGAVRVAL